jgi:hypothetical protein
VGISVLRTRNWGEIGFCASACAESAQVWETCVFVSPRIVHIGRVAPERQDRPLGVSCSFQNRTKVGFVVFKSGQRVSKTGLRILGYLGRLVNRRMGWVLDLGW